jgi:hypothetical protein
MVKGRSPRVVFRERLRIAKSFIESDIRILDSFSGKVWVPHTEREPSDPYLRDRRPEEFMEAQSAPWLNIARDFDALASYFAAEARNARAVAQAIDETGECPRYPSRRKKAS